MHTVRLGGGAPPPPPLTLSLTVKYPFFLHAFPYLKSIKLTKKVTFKEQMLEFRQVCTQNLTIVVQISQKLLDFETLHGLQNFLPNLPIFIHRYIRDILQFCVEGVVSKILMK